MSTEMIRQRGGHLKKNSGGNVLGGRTSIYETSGKTREGGGEPRNKRMNLKKHKKMVERNNDDMSS